MEAFTGIGPTPPRIPRGRLWACVLAPPVSIVVAMTSILLLHDSGLVKRDKPWLEMGLGMLVLVVCAVSLVAFVRLLKRRFLKRSTVLLTLAYFIGQGVVGTVLVIAGLFVDFLLISWDVFSEPGDFV